VDEGPIDVGGELTAGNKYAHTLNLDYKNLWALAMTTAVGGHYLSWSTGLYAGFGSFIIATFIVATGYICLMICSAELSSALPFAGLIILFSVSESVKMLLLIQTVVFSTGGAYGVSRATLGIFPGYLVACMDSLKSILFTSYAASTIGHIITAGTGAEERWEPFYWLIFYVLSLCLHIYGGRTLWRSFAALSIAVSMMLVIYLLGSIPYTDLPEHAPFYKSETDNEYERWFHGGMFAFMRALSFPSWFFIGIQNIDLACGEMRSPKTQVPKGYFVSIGTVVLTCFSVVLVACAIHPGTSLVKIRHQPLNRGYEKMFSISNDHASLLSLPATVSAGFGFMFFYGRQLRAMGESGLLNPIFAKEVPDRHTPLGALLIGSAIGYGLCLVTFVDDSYHEPLYNLSKLCSFATDLSIFLSFWSFRRNFPTILREFVSPLGMVGAYYGAIVSALAFISVCGFQKSHYAEIIFVGLGIIAVGYYYKVVEKRQVFSEEEKKVMFKAYLVKGEPN
jgi:amino acid transporter